MSVYALSTDGHEHAATTARDAGVTFPVLYGVDGASLAEAWGSYYEPRRDILHATGFILRPGGKLLSATYSTGPIGRIVAANALGFIQFVKKRES